MSKLEQLLQELITILQRPEQGNIKPVLLETITEALQEDMQRTRQEKEFHKQLNEDMLQGLHNIYKEIAQVASGTKQGGADEGHVQSAEDATAIFHEASRQLEEIMTTTLQAADEIMSRAEAIQERQEQVSKLLSSLKAEHSHIGGDLDTLHTLLDNNTADVTSIVLALSFQDLTGQRIKKVVQALSSIHQIVVQTYVSAGLMIKKSEEEPGKDLQEIAKESKKAGATVTGSELKGPTMDSSQKDVDDLLAQLGF